VRKSSSRKVKLLITWKKKKREGGVGRAHRRAPSQKIFSPLVQWRH
jgi:hypothetical protein